MIASFDELKTKFTALGGWQQRYRELMLLGKELPVMANELKVDDAKVAGCESNVWMYIDFTPQEDQLLIIADSDTRIVKGLLAVILLMYRNKTPAQVVAIDAEQEFDELGLLKHLSPSRGNGIRAIVQQINAFAQQHL
ncbi:SufE family protein [Pseudoalteromonas sp. BDTF-M6]|uniref:SufE family protein n=1 Tax=Pseudoalteromonas sp. BDTF-M6 TaxID=2796132 RepID=UPI001BAED531|nr:SufE family protein [Pseudoalteromonas sp. BDTF-M6]MBS3796761.1 SufE family protein [Pseudoalteromonas sp. BDTF-M6]